MPCPAAISAARRREPVHRAGPRLGREGPQRAEQLRLVGNHVVGRAGVEAGDRQHDRVEDIELPGHHRLQGGDDLARDRDRIGRPMRLGGMPAVPAHGQLEHVGGGHHRARPRAVDPAGQRGRGHVQRVGGHRPVAGRVQDALGDHLLRPRVALLARLEHEDHVPGQLSLPRRQQPGRPGQHRGVQVVAARVHRAVDLGGIGQAGALGHRQGIHVTAQQHRRARPAAAQHRGHRAQLAPAADLKRQPVERGEHLLLGPGQFQPDLRLAVNRLAQFGQLGGDLRGILAYLSRHRCPFARPGQ